MRELLLVLCGCLALFAFTATVIYPDLEVKGYSNIKSCYGECLKEYEKKYGTFREQMDAKRLANASDPYSDIRGLWAGCAACHGSDGQGIAAFPKLAGQSSSYIQKALEQYRAGETRGAQSVLMWGQAGNLTDSQISQLASFVEVELSE